MIRPTIPFSGGALRRFAYAPRHDERQTYPLLAHQDPDDCVAWRKGAAFVVADFLGAVAELASRLPAKRHAVNLCRDRYHFLVGFAAALVSKHVSLLPTCRAPESLAQLNDRYPETYVLADHEDVPGGLPVCRVPETHSRVSSTHEIPTISSERIAAVVFTSGSSGLPRAHVKTWGSLVRGADALARRLHIETPMPRAIVGTVPAQHMYGLETTIMLPLQQGWCIHAGHPILPADLRSDLDGLRVPAWLMTTPVHLRAYVSQQIPLSKLEGVVSATMPLSRTLAARAERLWGVPVQEIYGCTETGVIGSRHPTGQERWTLCRGLRLRQDGDAAWVSGGHVGAPFRLADRIAVHNEDQFVLHGPGYDLVKVAGKRASLAALNAALLGIDGVVDGTFYRPGAGRTGNGRLTAFVVAPGLTPAVILAALRAKVDPVFLPRPLHLVEGLPRNSTGKLPHEQLENFAARFIGSTRSRG
ncbi:MAG TPA: AMP-binding protein [Nitrospiraceae bacterium]|nr:AMP-binding protein [Nitrospiraceae bacterium]